MIVIVNAENRRLFSGELRQMHRHRKIVFVDRLHWHTPTVGELEVDAYDHVDTTYLIARCGHTSDVLASARLLPTTRPHLMSEVFAHACSAGPPCGPRVWEASRFCTSPSITSRPARLALLWELLCGIMETCLLYGVEQITFTANAALLPLVLRCGWDARALGPTLPDRDDEVTAVAVRVSPSGLQALRQRFDIHGPVTRFPSTLVRVAA